jgi:hypothetical protein
VKKVSLPILFLRLRGSREFQSYFAGQPRKRIAYFLPVRPFRYIRTFGFSLSNSLNRLAID